MLPWLARGAMGAGVIVLLAALVYLDVASPRAEQRAQAALKSSARNTAVHLQDWLDGRRAEATWLASDAELVRRVRVLLHDEQSQAYRDRVTVRFARIWVAHHYRSIQLLDSNNRLLAGVGFPPAPLRVARGQAAAIDSDGSIAISPGLRLFRGGPDGLTLCWVAHLDSLYDSDSAQDPVSTTKLVECSALDGLPFEAPVSSIGSPILSQASTTLRYGNSTVLQGDAARRRWQGAPLRQGRAPGYEDLSASVPVGSTGFMVETRLSRSKALHDLRVSVLESALAAVLLLAVVAAAAQLAVRQEQRRRLEHDLAQAQKSAACFRQFFELPFLGMGVLDPGTMTWVKVNPLLCTMTGFSEQEMLQMGWADFADAASRAAIEQLARGRAGQTSLQASFARKAAVPLPVSLSVRWVERQGEGNLLVTVQDLTERAMAEARNARLAGLQAALGHCGRAIAESQNQDDLFPRVCRDAVVLGGMSLAWIGMLDEESGAVIPVACSGNGTEYLLGIDISVDPNKPTGNGPVGRAIRTGEPVWCHDFVNDSSMAPWRARARDYGWKASVALPLSRGGKPVGVIGVYATDSDAFTPAAQRVLTEMAVDIGFALDNYAREVERERAVVELRTALARIQQLAHFDSLTGLPNRALLADRAQQDLARARRLGEPLALMFVDLDRFKPINDSLGHRVGDSVLQQVAARLSTLARTEDTVCRLGGDEFLVLMPNTDAAGAAHAARRMLDALACPVEAEGHELVVSASIGVAMYPTDGGTYEDLSRSADVAMYRAKRAGRGDFQFYTAEMQARSLRALQVESALRRAIEQDQLSLCYQPQIDLASGQVLAVEALLRWQHPELGSVSPAEFIPIAEDCGIILPLGEWVLQAAARQSRAWREGPLEGVTIAVNLSAVQFRQANLPTRIAQILEEEGVPPTAIELELTEGAAMEDPDAAAEMMRRMQNGGIRLAIDDFGTGYSSLSHLKRFHISKLKIDQSFVQGITDNSDDQAIVRALLTMSHSLGLRTLAEGVSSQEQLTFLRAHGCDAVQGFYFSEPLAAQKLEAFVRARRQAGLC